MRECNVNMLVLRTWTFGGAVLGRAGLKLSSLGTAKWLRYLLCAISAFACVRCGATESDAVRTSYGRGDA